MCESYVRARDDELFYFGYFTSFLCWFGGWRKRKKDEEENERVRVKLDDGNYERSHDRMEERLNFLMCALADFYAS